MKKTLFLLVIAILMSACQSAPQTPTETEALADSHSALIGIWYAKEAGLFYDITKTGVPDANLALSLYYVEPDPWQKVATATMNFENGKLTYVTAKDSCDSNPSATYEIYIVSQNGSVIGMRPKLVGEDACVERKASLDGKVLKRVTP